MDCKLISYSNNHIDLEIHKDNGNWRLTGFLWFSSKEYVKKLLESIM